MNDEYAKNEYGGLSIPDYSEGAPGLLTASSEGLQLQNTDINSVIDRDALWARARICTPRIDREGDVIEPSGVDWKDYSFAPTVKYEHGFSGIPFPIATSLGPDGEVHVNYDVDEDAIYAKSFFSGEYELSYQMFGLIDLGFLRATSIHVDPREGGVRSLQEGRFHVLQSNMLEWSWCTVGQNPDSYAKSLKCDSRLSEVLHLQLEAASQILERGTIGNARLLPSLAKCLKAAKPPRENIVRGHSVTEDAMGTKSLTVDQIKKLSTVALAKALCETATYDAATVKELRSFAKSMPGDDTLPKADMPMDTVETPADAPVDDTLPKSDDAPAEAPIESTPAMPMGAQFVSAFHDNLSSLITNAESEGAKVENPAVKDAIGPVIDDLRSKLAELEGLFSSVYPDQSPLSVAADSSEDVDLAKSWIAQNRTQFQLAGLAQRLTGVMDGSIGASKAKSVIAGTVRDLQLLNSQAKSFKPPVPKDMVPKADHDALKAEYKVLEAKTQKLVNKMKGEAAPI